MEIAYLSNKCLRIKGKKGVLLIDPIDTVKKVGSNNENANQVVLLLSRDHDVDNLRQQELVIDGAGEYEVYGLKINSIQGENGVIYSLLVDGIEILLGKLSVFEKMQHKLKEQHILIVMADSLLNSSFITSLASNVVVLYGDQAQKMAETFGTEVKKIDKYSVSLDKLPSEAEIVLLG